MEKYKMVNTQELLIKKNSFFKDLFSFFKLKASERQNAEKPADLKTWIIHGLSEFIGTIFLSLALAGLSIYTSSGKVAEEYMLHKIIVGFYAGFIAVGVVLFIFLRWSCDLNPAVTIYRYINGRNNGYYALYKIAIQFLGAFAAAGFIYLFGYLSVGKDHLPNAPITAIGAYKASFVAELEKGSNPSANHVLASGTAWIFFVELVMTAILLFPIFSPNVNNKYRDLMIMFIISLSVWMGILGATAAINPARGLAQQLPAFFTSETHVGKHLEAQITGIAPDFGFDTSVTLDQLKNSKNSFAFDSLVYATFAMLLGDLLAPVFYAFIQGFTQRVVNPFVVKVIAFKNFRADSMTTPEKEANKSNDNKQ
ncbi:aquaporin [Mycoplasma sp. 1199]|uniref:aquaporin n=1 Tax=Mycoplasma sp. 1199 TaxID=3108526 RepID=UPI002B1E0ED1|nr:aquaporin [Mycoplasma sp. 1199]MEA4206430.1 aquaporin [Mycoplasma sp. 1199]